MAEEHYDVFWPGWNIAGIIGHGSYGRVYAIERNVFGHTEKDALKVISIPQNDGEIEELYNDGYDNESITNRFKGYLQDIVREYSLMSEMKGHTNIVYCDDLRYVQHVDGVGWDIYIKMELLTPLPKILDNRYSEKLAIKLGLDICNALILCKRKNIVHRDIKPQNIFVSDDGNFKLGDFGIAKTAERTTSGTKTGTYKYMAPEVYNNQPYGHAADIYSLGMVLYWLLNERRTPFLPIPPQIPTAIDEERARDSRFSGFPIPEPVHGSSELKRIVLKACAFSPEDRYKTAAEMRKDLLSLIRKGSYVAQPPRTKSPTATESPKQVSPQPTDETVGTFGRDHERKMPSEETICVRSHSAEGSKSTGRKDSVSTAANESISRHNGTNFAATPDVRKNNERHFLRTLITTFLIFTLLSIGCIAIYFMFGKAAKNQYAANMRVTDSMEFADEIKFDFWIDVCYHFNGGHDGPDSLRCAVYNQELTFVHPTIIPQREGYTFVGWLYGNNNAYDIDTPGETVSFGGISDSFPLDYYAQWIENSTGFTTEATLTDEMEPDFWIDVCYHFNGGHDGPDSLRCAVYNQELTFVHPTIIPQREGYTFVGWLYGNNNAYDIDTPGETVSFGGISDSFPLDYYAQWIENSTGFTTEATLTDEMEPDFWIDVCYHFNGGHDGPDRLRCAVYNQELTFVHPTIIPQREGYTFIGWLYDNSDAYEIDIPGKTIGFEGISDSFPLHYYAQWIENSAKFGN